jgi:sugar phosphate isomerase/epimerase
MNRREFLRSGASLLGGLWAIEAAAAGSGVSLGFSLYGMKDLPVEEALQVCARIGYRHVELALNAGYPTEPKEFSAEARRRVAGQLAALNLEVPCLMLNLSLTADAKGHEAALRSIGEAARVARDLQPNQPPMVETVLGGKPALWEEQKGAMVTQLRDWAAAAKQSGVVIALKAHVASAVNSPERLLWLLDQVPSDSLALAYDFSHFEVQGMDLEESLRAMLPRTRFIHVKDSLGDPQKFQFLLPGEGRTDYAKYFSLLKRLGYSGPVCVEVSGMIFKKPGYDPVDAATRSFAALNGALASVK